jgi:hypothetical protein
VRSISLLATLVMLTAPAVTSAQETGRVGGRVVDAASGEPVEGVLVRVDDVAPTLSDDRGLFELARVPVGEWGISFQHLAYGNHERTVAVRAGEETAIVAEISVEAIDLEEVVVETFSELERRRITSGHSINELSLQEIDAAARAGLSFGDLLLGSLPGVDVRPDELGLCVTYRAIRTGNDLGDCDGVSVVLDGVPVADPAYVYSSIPLQDIERIEVLSPAQAGVRYGMRNGQGALIVETKRGPVQRRSDMTRYLTGLDWSNEARPYPWLKVFGSAFLVNAAALGISYLMVDECFWTQEASLALRTRCGPLGTTGAAVLSVALPAAGAGVVARWAGSTDRSRGRLVPAMVAGALALSAGYIMVLGGEGGAEMAGGAVLGLGVPAVLTLADRIIRIRR